MIVLLDWTTYGTWLPGPARGRTPGSTPMDAGALVEPDEALSRARRSSLEWPVVHLDGADRGLILSDLDRIAALRGLTLRLAVVAPDHVHLLVGIEGDRATSRIVQLIKGSLSRTLSTAAGDPPATTERGAPMPHHKWWSGQYAMRRIAIGADLDAVETRLLAHAGEPSCDGRDWRGHAGRPL